MTLDLVLGQIAGLGAYPDFAGQLPHQIVNDVCLAVCPQCLDEIAAPFPLLGARRDLESPGQSQ